MDIRGKVILITGASAGIGRAAARELARAGAHVALVARSAERLISLAAELQGTGARALAVPADVGDPDRAAAAVAACVAQFGGLDVLVNNAAIGLHGPTAGLTPAQWQAAFATNVLGPMYLIHHAVPALQRQGGGLIVNVSSPMGKIVVPYLTPYCATKAALDRYTASLRAELAPAGIRVLEFNPGQTATEIFERALGPGHPHLAWLLRGAESAESVALKLRRQIERETPVVYCRWRSRWTGLLARLAGPAWIERRVRHLVDQ